MQKMTTSHAKRACALVLFLLVPAGAAFPSPDPSPATGLSRILVAPADVSGSLADDPIAETIPALVAEAVGLRASFPASLARDLSPETIEKLALPDGAVPTRETLTPSDAAEILVTYGSVRVLLLPDLGKSGSGYKLKVAWRDLPTGKKGSVTETAASPREIAAAVDRAVAAARSEWQQAWKGPASGKGQAAGKTRSLVSSVSAVPGALGAWARAGAAWGGGDVPAAEKALDEALAADPGFDRARVDLAWIRLAEERRSEAGSLASKAMAGGHLSPSSAAMASIIAAAAAADTGALDKIADDLTGADPGSPLGFMARGLGHNIAGVHERAVSELDPMLLQRPNDPALLHEAGMAALGVGDDYESVRVLGRAAKLWPQHDRIQMDLAEAKLRAHDIDGAADVLHAWAGRFDPSVKPIWGGEWTPGDPPPPVREICMLALQGSIADAVDKLEKLSSALSVSSAPVPVRIAVLASLHEMQMQLTSGPELEKQRWLNAARGSLKELASLMTPEQKQAKPWFLDRLNALVRLGEGRIPEARELRQHILDSSDLPGYDPGIEAELQVDIALKEADTKTFFEAAQRAVSVRDLLTDRFRILQGRILARSFDDAEDAYKELEDRLRFWNGAHRRDALLWTPIESVAVPYIYYMGAEVAVNTARADVAHKRFGIFLSYFRRPDERFQAIKREALDRGAVPSW